jgi:class 3 adenylate cyclase
MNPPQSIVGTVLFTDLVGFTDYNDSSGDAAAVAVLERQRRLADDALAGCDEARVVKELGDGLMLWFPTAADGICVAGQLMARFVAARHNGSFPLSARMGAHHGEAAIRGDDLVGRTVNIAARVCDLAGPSELLVSAATVAACEPRDRPDGLRPVGPVRVKGVRDAVWLHRLS